MIDDNALLANFVEESQQHLQTIEPDLLALEESGDNVDAEVVNRIFRSVHSIKGASGFFGLQRIGELSHVMENLLSLLREKKISVTRELMDALLSGIDALKAMVDDVSGSEQFDVQNEVSQLHKVLENAGVNQRTPTGDKEAERIPQKKKHQMIELSEEVIKNYISHGQYLYSVKIFLNQDLRSKGKTPYDYINNMESLGQFVDSFLDVASVTGLGDCLTNDLAFNFIFATVLEPDLVSTGLEISEDRIKTIDLKEWSRKSEQKEASTVLVKPKVADSKKEEHAPAPAAAECQAKRESVEPAKTGPKVPVQTEEKLRVGVNLLNDLVNLAGEMVLGRNQLLQISIPMVKQVPNLNTVLQHVSRITTEMQEKIMHLRMQPVSILFSKFHRVVRDLAKTLEKDITLETEGEDVELDKSIIETLSDPLTHLIRNSVDHGVEHPDEREKAGKPRQGKIKLRAYHQGGQVHLEITDDGKGIDGQIVGRKAVEKGIITKEQMESMSDKDLIKLTFRPGFSTAQKVSSVSGRGVGLDVVLTNIQHLGGNVDIDTIINKGTKINLILPLTLAIVSGLVIKLSDQVFVLPEVNIDEMVRIKPDEIKSRINVVHNAQVLRLRDMLLPLVNLKDVLEGDHTPNETMIIANNNEPLRILMLKHGSARFGLIVDSVENMEEIVVKPLPHYLKKMKCFSGATIMGDGRVALILDVAGIIQKAKLQHFEEKEEDEKVKIEKTRSEGEVQTLLLFDNNTQERFALPLELITRIESVPVSKIETIKENKYLQYHGENLQLIFLEDYLPVQKPERKTTDKVGIIIPKMMKFPMGIVINRIIDTISTVVKLDTKTIMAPGLFGTAVLEGKITLIIDMYRLFEMAAPEWYKTEKTGKWEEQKKRRILLVEDTPFFRMVETDYLLSAGYEVVHAEDGKQALEILEEQSFDAMILDVIMPVLDGWGVIKAIREDPRWKDLPVLAVTSLGDEENARRGLRAGFTDWEAKLNKTRLLEKLSAILAHKEEVMA